MPAAGLELLAERFPLEIGGEHPPRGWLLAHAPGASAIVVDPSISVEETLLDAAAGTLAVVANFGVGLDNIDLDLAQARGLA